MASDRRDWGLLDVLDAFAAGERSPHVWASAGALATLIRRESNAPFGRQRLEQTLSSTQREELGALLRYACYRALCSDPSASRGAIAAHNDDGSPWRDHPARWQARLDALRGTEWDETLQGAASALEPSEPDVPTLALAALRIAEDATCRLYLAHDLTARGEYERAARSLDGVLGAAPTGPRRARALLARAFAFACAGRIHEAALSYRDTAREWPALPTASLGWLTIGLRLESRVDCTEAGYRLADTDQSEDELRAALRIWSAGLDAKAANRLRSRPRQVGEAIRDLPAILRDALLSTIS